MAKFCTNCGAPVCEDMKFCGSCGSALTGAAPAPAAAPKAAHKTAAAPPPDTLTLTPKTKKILIWVGIVIVVLAVLGGMIITAIRRSLYYGVSAVGSTSSILEFILRRLLIRLL